MSNRTGKAKSWWAIILLGLAAGACGGEPLDDDVGETASATDPWGWCVDHPCPNLEAVGYGGCPFASGLLLLGVKNVGNLTAIPTKTSYKFYKTKIPFPTKLPDPTFDTESLSPGETAAYWIPAPTSWVDGCTATPCYWRVGADATDLINEVDGTNNHRSGTCWFPE